MVQVSVKPFLIVIKKKKKKMERPYFCYELEQRAGVLPPTFLIDSLLRSLVILGA